ncbi:unnamed protein product [Calicophoron daubneyi]|uniref:Ubiquitin-like domain-containing protein n=1 Tax=Calicophoron daubneyi TaxID=300641 RepID=A0AAV2TQK9_CALDB
MATDTPSSAELPKVESSVEHTIHFTVVHNRVKHQFGFPPNTTILEIKKALEPLTQVPVALQKLIYHTVLSDASALQDLHLPSKGAKLMLLGTSQSEADQIRQAEALNAVRGDFVADVVTPEPAMDWCEQPEHKRVLERFGKPEGAMVGILNTEEMLAPDECLTGLYDKRGRPLRLRVRPDTCELWLATTDVTHKFPLATIHDVISQPIKDHPEYHIMAFQLGPTPKSRYFVYWLPSQYVDSIKTMVLQHKVVRSAEHSSM